MEPKNPERSNTNSISPSHHDNNQNEENEYKPMDIQRKGKTTTLKTFLNDDLKKLAEIASKKNGYS